MAVRAANLSERQFGDFTLKYAPPDMDYPRHRIIAEHPKGMMTSAGYRYAGEMNWHPSLHHVTSVNVDEPFRRQGLASEMWKMGQDMKPRPRHSSDRTNAGDAWAKSVGGRLPRRRKNFLRGDE